MLPKTAEYALRAVVCLGIEAGRSLSADHLAKVTKVPRRYLNKVLQELVDDGLIRSQPGPGGGYALAKSLQRISILDVVRAITPLERIDRCPLGLRSHTSLCPLHKELDRVYAETEKALSIVTISQLIHSKSRITPLCEVS
jgi:Rrf2 family protein